MDADDPAAMWCRVVHGGDTLTQSTNRLNGRTVLQHGKDRLGEAVTVQRADQGSRSVATTSGLAGHCDGEIRRRFGDRPRCMIHGSSQVIQVHDLFDDPRYQVVTKSHD